MASMRNGSAVLARTAASVAAMLFVTDVAMDAAHAQSGTVACTIVNRAPLTSVTNPPPADRQEIMDLLHRYNWALDEGTLVDLDPLFAAEPSYELCNSLLLQQETRSGKQQVLSYLDGLKLEVKRSAAGTRHIESNTLLNAVNADTVEGKSTVLVTIQFSGIETPVLDYTAKLASTFVREIDPAKQAPAWKIKSLILLADGPKIVLRAR
ncbi:nuclear transport factor 2 family protein [Rhizobium sp. S152]|uniref:nuclear transport factor 2 family protein n=1 Tax=Rhizobium sp. S152 TaxID=3055038 RepID=UPI0025A98A1E|nr:nuclear transport factor 2 family protein [Rhizobium sp. S152]MDM9625614.1 nuclear transport factor 2 family protein [Rhizobium sp. S152]